MKEKMFFLGGTTVSEPSHPTDELAQNVSKKSLRTNYCLIFPSKFQNLTVFSIICIIRIRFSGPREYSRDILRAHGTQDSSRQGLLQNQGLETILICNVVLCYSQNHIACIHMCDVTIFSLFCNCTNKFVQGQQNVKRLFPFLCVKRREKMKGKMKEKMKRDRGEKCFFFEKCLRNPQPAR